MSVPSFSFLGLAVVGALLFWLGRGLVWRGLVMLAINLFFVSQFGGSVAAFLPFAWFILLGYGCLRLGLRGDMRRRWILPALILLSFLYIKRYPIMPGALALHGAYVTIGVSYIFFRVMHIVVDRPSDFPAGWAGLLSYLNYTLNFTSLVSGPIQRFAEYRRFEVQGAPLGFGDSGRAVERIIIGYFKVYIVSSLLLAQQIAAAAGVLQGDATCFWDAVMATALYPLFLYFNFYGYTDFVIGVARFFGLILPENFDAPFAATNFIEFWNRWHITLSSWLKNYVYMPLLLGGMRRVRGKRGRTALGIGAYFCTFFLVGAWHGQTPAFLFFGVLQGAGVAANRLYQSCMSGWLGLAGYTRLCGRGWYRALCRGLTFAWFATTLLWFWSDWGSLGRGFATIGLGGALAGFGVIWGAAVVLLAGLDFAGRRVPWPRDRYRRTAMATALAMIIVAANLVVNAPAPRVVYTSF